MTSINWLKLHEYDTVYSADSVEWCPHDPNKNLFVVGTYQLNENNTDTNNQKRIGQILLFSFTKNQLKCIQTINTAAILDQKWCPKSQNNCSLLATANALGQIHLYQLNNNELIELATSDLKKSNASNELLSLSLDWSSTDSLQSKLCVSDSTGCITLFQFDGTQFVCVSNWKAHDFEAWICAFNYWNDNIVLTGGDDCKLKMFDTRCNSTITTKNYHTAGVTSLHFNKYQEHIFVSGSYDENVLLWDLRAFNKPLSELKTSGGVWRLKWSPNNCSELLAACMYGSFHIIDASVHTNIQILANYCEHSSICYGCDWSYLNTSNSYTTITSCSFYDHLLNISNFIK